MAVTQIADIYEPLTFNAAVDEAAIEKNAFLNSGVMVTSPEISAQASAGGRIGELPFHKDVDKSAEPNYTTDNPATTSTPAKITTGKMIFRLASMHGSWSTMDLTRQLSLMDPLAAITRRIGSWWATQVEKRVVNSAHGIMLDNIANDSGDMVVDIYSDIATPLAANIIEINDVIDAQQTAGDQQEKFAVIAMHSVTYTVLRKADVITFEHESDQDLRIPMYMGMRVVVDDSLKVVAGSQSPAYHTILFEVGAFEHGSGMVNQPSELERVASAGNGGGQDIIHSRKSEIIHPYGFQFVSASIAGQSATLAELADATEWDRVVDRKNVGMAFIRHNV